MAVIAIVVTSAVAGGRTRLLVAKEIYPTRDIVENAVSSADHSTLVAAEKAAGLVP
jgi:uncharacterized surface protein with fasciclin (FAS1) repeats